MSTPPYVELHCHSAYSFLDGVSLPQELAARASELGHTALALTDHNSLSGSMELAQSAPESGIRAIHGAEIDVDTGGPRTRHLTLLASNEQGWRNLCRIVTIAHARTREGSSRRELTDPSIALQALMAHAEGLVCLTGCASRSVIGAGREDEPACRLLLDAFGPENLYVELQRPFERGDRARNRALEAFGRRLGLRCVATGDVHAHARSRAELQDAFVAIRNHCTLDACEPLRRPNHSHVMSTPEAMARRFIDHPRAVRESVLLAERLRFDLRRDLGYRYPGAEDEGSARRLAELCLHRLEERYGPGSEPGARALHGQARARLEQELQVIDKLGLAGFFLLHHDMLELAREVAVEVRGADSVRAMLAPGRGRGSSVSSIVCYLTGLSHIDPIAGRLALGRFLHEDLSGLPDIDLDFPRDIRERLIPRVHERYGHDRAALVAAFPTFRARGAIRELGKVLGPARRPDRAARPRGGQIRAPGRARCGHRARRLAHTGGRGEEGPQGGGGRERPLELALISGRAGAWAAPPPLTALRGDDHRDPAADRLLPCGARGDGGQADGPVGQGLLRGCRLSEDRPARAGDALGGRAVRGRSGARAGGADRPVPHTAG